MLPHLPNVIMHTVGVGERSSKSVVQALLFQKWKLIL